MTTAAEFRAALAAQRRRVSGVLAGAAAYLAAGCAASWLLGPGGLDLLPGRPGPAAREALFLAAVVAPTAAIMVGGFGLCEHRSRRDPHLTCPACGGMLDAGVALATRNCGRCGRPALDKRDDPDLA